MTDPFTVHSIVMKCSDELLDQGVDPLEIAAAHITHAQKIYRTVLSEEDYVKMMKTVYETCHRVEPIKPVILH